MMEGGGDRIGWKDERMKSRWTKMYEKKEGYRVHIVHKTQRKAVFVSLYLIRDLIFNNHRVRLSGVKKVVLMAIFQGF